MLIKIKYFWKTEFILQSRSNISVSKIAREVRENMTSCVKKYNDTLLCFP